MRCNAEFYYVWKIPRIRYWAPVAAATHGFEMVLFTASRRNSFVGGTCAPPSTLLVLCLKCIVISSLLTNDLRIHHGVVQAVV